jgi:ketosteroid isomerase-like protein
MSSIHKEVIRKLNRGFEAGDEEAILSCLTDDVRWDVPGAFTAIGKEAYRQNITNENFTGRPVISHKSEVEEGDKVSVEGRVEGRYKNGDPFKAIFHNAYTFEHDKIKAMTSYLVPVN